MIPVNKPSFIGNESKYLIDCIKSGWISSDGKYVSKFEKLFANFVSRKFSTTVTNGSVALEIAIKALKLKPGSEVILPTFTIISCCNAIIKAGLKPVLVDCYQDTFNMNVDHVKKKINKKTSAIMMVHIYGITVDVDKILSLAKKYKLKVIEDAAEVHGQKYKNKPCGSFGDISTFSFYVNKHITTGEGGAIFTNSKIIYEKCKNLRNLNFGNNNRFNHEELGWNYRFTNMQAALGLNQLKRINEIIKKKREIGNYFYNNLKNNNNIIVQKPSLSYCKNVYWIFGILIKNSNKKNTQRIQKKLQSMGIQTRDFFWPMHKQNIYKKMGLFKGQNFPIAEYLANNGFYIPSGLGLKKLEMVKICKCINKIL